MSATQRIRGTKVLKAVSSPLRLQILNLLFDKGPLSYTELMASLKMNPSRDAGRFAYHLKFLLKADLVETIVESKKYCLTDLGKMVIEVADRIEKKASKPKGVLVRTSRFALEEFDANKIASSLIREAKIPAELAQKVAKEAERHLLKSKTKYLTAPLVREVVNAILIDKGLEEYRHKLTRLGIPVYDVASLIESRNPIMHGFASSREVAGSAVFREYMLLDVLPRDIADAHLSGALHIRRISSWILYPEEIIHDARYFMQNGLNPEKLSIFQPSHSKPDNLESVLSLLFNVLLDSGKEVSGTQVLSYFNVFLAHFVRDLDASRVKEILRLFIANIGRHANVSIDLELAMPDFLNEKSFPTLTKEVTVNEQDLNEKAQLVASLLLEIMMEESNSKPIINPKLLVKLRRETFMDNRAIALLLKAHNLASTRGNILFADLSREDRRHSAYSCSGIKLDTDLSKDWEIDTVRTGCLGVVTLNLPRIVYESAKDKTKFFQMLKERVEMASRALEIKYRALKQHGTDILPFIRQSTNGDHYFRLENCSRIVNLAGLKEAAQVFSGKTFDDQSTLQFAAETTEAVRGLTQKLGRRCGKRLFPAAVFDLPAAERLAQSDIERYGVAKVKFSGSRDLPFYSTVGKLKLDGEKISKDSLAIECKLSEAYVGGSLTVIDLGETEFRPDALLSLTKEIVDVGNVNLFTYNRRLTHCLNCRRSWFGLLHKCPSCAATGSLAFFDPFAKT